MFRHFHMLRHIKAQGWEKALHDLWQKRGYVPSNYRIFDVSSANRDWLYLWFFGHVMIVLFYTLPLVWLYARFDLWDLSQADVYIWGSWAFITGLLIYRVIPLYCDVWWRKKIVIKATFRGYKYVGGINKYDFKTLVFETKSGKVLFIKPFWPREQEIVAKFLGDGQEGHPVYIEKTGFGGRLLKIQSDWKALGQEP